VGVKVRGRKKLENDRVRHESVRRRHHGGRIMTHRPISRTAILDNPMVKMDTLRCQVIVVGTRPSINVGMRGVMLVHTAKIPVCITAILKKSDKLTGKLLEKSPKYLKIGDAGWMLIRPDYLVSSESKPLAKPAPRAERPIGLLNEGYCVDAFANCSKMARFAFFVNSTECNMIGKITEINPTGKKYYR